MKGKAWSVVWAPLVVALACVGAACSSPAPAAEVSADVAVNGPAAPKALEEAQKAAAA